jgi:hypothetical protein
MKFKIYDCGEKELKKGATSFTHKFGDQSILRSVDFRLEEKIISGIRRGAGSEVVRTPDVKRFYLDPIIQCSFL